MRKVVLYIMILLFTSCSCSDDASELSGGYFLRMEAKDLNDILSHEAWGTEIPSNVLSLAYNSEFILAKQRPSEIDDPLYKKHIYKYGRHNTYYWIIVHQKKLVLGPMSEEEFINARVKYEVPNSLTLESIWN
jgi:hypothetical protein